MVGIRRRVSIENTAMAASKEANSHFVSRSAAVTGAMRERRKRIFGVGLITASRVQKRLPVSLAAIVRERARCLLSPNLLEFE